MKTFAEGLAHRLSVREVPDSDLYPQTDRQTAQLYYISSGFPQSFTYMHGY
jgi:hypothetical protein